MSMYERVYEAELAAGCTEKETRGRANMAVLSAAYDQHAESLCNPQREHRMVVLLNGNAERL